MRPHEFGDDRLGIVAAHLTATDWNALENALFDSCSEIDELPTRTLRVDATATCGYHTIEPDGIMQLGHSKDHRLECQKAELDMGLRQAES